MLRTFLKSAAAAAALLVLTAPIYAASPALASAPMAKTNAPEFYRFMLGNFEVTALGDGTTDLPVDQLLKTLPPEKVHQLLAKAYLKSPLETSFNAFLINTGDKLILIDTGAGNLFGPTLGKLLANIKASGYQPEQVDQIYITHFHPDHIGGLSHDGVAVFPNAIVRADKAEADFWLSPANLESAPAAMKGYFQGAQGALAPYVASGHFDPFNGAGQLTPGIRAVPTHGHTPGHSSYLVESQGQKLLVIGDLIHVGAIQFNDPSVTIGFDSTPADALAERQAVFAEAAKDGEIIAGAHLAFPGLGHIVAKGGDEHKPEHGHKKHEQKTSPSYVWIPLNFTQIH